MNQRNLKRLVLGCIVSFSVWGLYLSGCCLADGPDVQKYCNSVPGSLTSLTLRVKVETADLQTLATRVPDLTYLHLEPRGYSNSYGSIIRTIPKLFPKLRTLKIR